MRSNGLDTPLPRRHLLALFILTCMAIGLAAGCQEVLFPKDVPRTQFEAYDRMRNQAAPEEQHDVFGRPEPALRERLSQR